MHGTGREEGGANGGQPMAALDGGEALVTAVYKTVEANAGLVISPARWDYQAGHLPPTRGWAAGLPPSTGSWWTGRPAYQRTKNVRISHPVLTFFICIEQ